MDKNIENTNNQLKYIVIRSEKGTVSTFELYSLKVIALIVRYTISGSCKSSQFLFLIIACLLRHSSIRIYGTKNVIEPALTTMMS